MFSAPSGSPCKEFADIFAEGGSRAGMNGGDGGGQMWKIRHISSDKNFTDGYHGKGITKI